MGQQLGKTAKACGKCAPHFNEELDNLPIGVFHLNNEGLYTFVNQKWAKLTSLTFPHYQNSSWLDSIHPADQVLARSKWAAFIENNSALLALTFRVFQEGNTIAWLSCKIAARHDENGQLSGFVATCDEIETPKEIPAVDHGYQEFIQKCLIVSTSDTEGRITFANDMFCKITGFSREELIGQHHRILKSGQMPLTFYSSMWNAISSGKLWRGQICNRTKSGTLFWVETTIIPMQGADGKIERYLSIHREITKEKMGEIALKDALQKSLQGASAKTDFLSMVSHELRTPLSGIVGMTSLLGETQLTAEQKEYSDELINAGHGLLSVVNTVLDFSRLQAGTLRLENSQFNPNSVLQESIKTYQASAAAKHLQFNLDVQESPVMVFGDGARVKQVLSSLISNAVNFTQSGTVTIHSRIAPVGTNKVQFLFQVSDTGSGISETIQKRLFKVLSPASQPSTTEYTGSGLGLTISRRLTELMRGKFSFHTEINKGSTFTVELSFNVGIPILASRATNKSLFASSPPKRFAGRILVAEDNGINQKVMAKMLDNWNCDYTIVANGKEALEALDSSKFDLVLMDCQMPLMDGFEATRNIRSSASLNMTVPIVAITANAIRGVEQRCRDSGMNEYLTKPFDLKRFGEVLGKYLHSDSTFPENKLVNRNVLGKASQLQAAGKPDIVIELIDAYLKVSAKRFVRLTEMTTGNDFSAIASEVIALKSAALAVGATAVAMQCMKIEKFTKFKTDVQALPSIEQLKIVLDLTAEYLKKIRTERSKPQKALHQVRERLTG